MRHFAAMLWLAVSCIAVSTSGCSSSASAPPQGNPRNAVERYVVALLAGNVMDGVALSAKGDKIFVKSQIKEMRQIRVQTLKMVTVHASKKHGKAIAVSEAVTLAKADPDGRDTGVLVFEILKSEDKWLVDDIDFDTEETAVTKVDGFRQMYADATAIAPMTVK